MTSVASRELRNNTRSLLDRVAAGESISITVDGHAVAVLEPVDRKPTWMSRAAFIRSIVEHQADSDLLHDLAAMMPDTTDDLGPM